MTSYPSTLFYKILIFGSPTIISCITPLNNIPKIDLWMKHLTALNCSPHIIDSARSLEITLDKPLNMQDHTSMDTKGAN